MARHSPPRETGATASRRTVVAAACLNVVFVVLLLAVVVSLSRLATGADVEVSSSLPNNGGEQQTTGGREHGHGAARRRIEDDRCAAGYHAGAGFDGGYPRGYVDYLYLFHCVLDGERRRALGYAAMAAWLAVLFYLLGDTAATYFCASLDGLARLLRLPPAIAGATLLALGNGAPDALSTVASFACAGGGTAAVGLGGVLGGAMFVSSAVLGVIGLRLGGQGAAVDRASFFRDAAFLLLALAAVAVVLAAGEVTVWGAAAFASIYLVYVLAVAFTPDRRSGNHYAEAEHTVDIADSSSSELHDVAETKFYADQEAQQEPFLLADDTAPLLQHYAGGGAKGRITGAFLTVARAVNLPLRLPRQLTIPDASSKERWSKPVAVTSATLAPLLLAFLCRHAFGTRTSPYLAVLAMGFLAGLSLGVLAFLTTDAAGPPTRPLALAAWLAGGFAMSVAWASVVAGEVLALLASAGVVLSVDAAALGVTVLAWGNSFGDLVTNVAVASSRDGGAQVAVSGCYGGPVFNVLVGLGLSMLFSCWTGYPRPVEVPREAGLYQTLGFVAVGVVWAAVVLHRRGMRVDRTLGLGLLAVYLCFLCVNISQVVLLRPKGRQ